MKNTSTGKVYNQKETDRSPASEQHKNDILSIKEFSVILESLTSNDSFSIEYAVTSLIADIVIRRKKMQGFSIHRFNGTGHSGMETGKMNDQLGILNGFTENRAPVKKVEREIVDFFVRFYRDGKIYRGNDQNKDLWFLKTADTTKAALDAAEQGEIVFANERWKKTYINLLKNIQDLCIAQPGSEGFVIPVFLCKNCGSTIVEKRRPEKCRDCKSNDLSRGSSRINSWFSSLMRSIIASRFRDGSKGSNFCFPAALTVTGSDKIYSWIIRSVLLSLMFLKEIPFREVLISGTPALKKEKFESIIQEYGPDIFRFSIACQSKKRTDISISKNIIKNSRSFEKKMKNASRYIVMNLTGDEDLNIDFNQIHTTDKWILSYLNNTAEKVYDFLDNYRISEVADLLLSFIRRQYCDWYLEFSKKDITNLGTRKVLKLTLFRLIQLLHPFMPFLTEEIYQNISKGKGYLIETELPSFSSKHVFLQEFKRIELLKKIITGTRKLRSENKIDPRKKIKVFLKTENEKEKKMIKKELEYFNLIAGSTDTEIVDDLSAFSKGFRGMCQDWEILLPFFEDKERLKNLENLKKELKNLEDQIQVLGSEMAESDFIKKISASALLNSKNRFQRLIDKRDRIQRKIDDLS